MSFLMIPVSTLYNEYIVRPKLSEQKKPFDYIVPPPSRGVGTMSYGGCSTDSYIVPIVLRIILMSSKVVKLNFRQYMWNFSLLSPKNVSLRKEENYRPALRFAPIFI